MTAPPKMQLHLNPKGGYQYLCGSERRFLYGYRVDDEYIKLPDLPEMGNHCQLQLSKQRLDRAPVSTSLGCGFAFTAPFKPDIKDTLTTQAGCIYRVLRATKRPDPLTLMKFRLFCKKFFKREFEPLDPACDTSYERFRETVNLPEWRKKQYDAAYEQVREAYDSLNFEPKHTKVKSFIKEETYPTYKHSRVINARADYYKVCVGPIFQLLNEAVFQKPYFIKKIPVDKRAEYVYSYLKGSSVVFETDFTSYESSFCADIMENIEFEFYKYMVRNIPDRFKFLYAVKFLFGTNYIILKDNKIQCNARRMSGEMNTSLGNGIMNKLLLAFVCDEMKLEYDSVHEGDDGLIAFYNKVDPVIFEQYYTNLGFTLKLKRHNSVGEASFCGQIFGEDLKCIREPIDTIVNFNWVPMKYIDAGAKTLRKLLRCKALSLACEMRQCPILGAFADYVIRLTEDVQVDEAFINKAYTDQYERSKYLYAISKPYDRVEILISTRYFFEKTFNIPVVTQIYLESIFDNAKTIQTFDDPVIRELTRDYHEHYFRYTSDVRQCSVASKNLKLINMMKVGSYVVVDGVLMRRRLNLAFS